MLTKLTAKQESLLAVTRDKWLAIGTATRLPDDNPWSDIDAAYATNGLKPPSLRMSLPSPLHGAVGAVMLSQVRAQVGAQVRAQVRDQVRAQVGDQVWDQVRGQVWDQVGAQVGDQVRAQVWGQVGGQVRAQVGDQVGGQVWAQVRDQVRDQVWGQVGGQVGGQVRAQVGDQVGDQVRAQVRDQVWGQVLDQVGGQVRGQVGGQVRGQVRDQVYKCGYGLHDSGWLSFYDFFLTAADLECCKKLLPLMRLAKSCGWWWPFAGACVVTPRPSFLLRDDEGRLHSETGPSIAYGDSWSIYAIHGVRVPEAVVARPESQTIEEISGETNTEVQRIRIERYGWPRYLSDTGARVLDFRQNDIDGTKESLMESVNGSRVIVCACPSTARVYAMRVDSAIASCEQAQQWLRGDSRLRIVGAS